MLLRTRSEIPATKHATQPGSAANPPEKYVPEIVYKATRSLIRVKTSEEALARLLELVRKLGGNVVPASANDPDAIEIDLSLGQGEALYPAAEPGSAARWLISTYLPDVVEDVGAAFELTKRAEKLAADAGIDPVTSLPNHHALSRLVTRLEPGDAIVALDLDWMRALGAKPETTDQEVLRLFARDLRSTTRANEFCGRTKGGEFIALLGKPGPEGPTKFLERLRERWHKRQASERFTFSAGIAPVDERGWRPAIQAADSAMRRGQEKGDRWEHARNEDYAA